MDIKNSEASTPDRTKLYRGIGLILIGLGGFLAGAGFVSVSGWPNPFESLSLGLVLVSAVGLAFFGVWRNGLEGMIVFGLAYAVIGLQLADGYFPVWVYALGAPAIAFGTIFRALNPP